MLRKSKVLEFPPEVLEVRRRHRRRLKTRAKTYEKYYHLLSCVGTREAGWGPKQNLAARSRYLRVNEKRITHDIWQRNKKKKTTECTLTCFHAGRFEKLCGISPDIHRVHLGLQQKEAVMSIAQANEHNLFVRNAAQGI
jgi:hypothetical protein